MLIAENWFRRDLPYPRTGCNLICSFEHSAGVLGCQKPQRAFRAHRASSRRDESFNSPSRTPIQQAHGRSHLNKSFAEKSFSSVRIQAGASSGANTALRFAPCPGKSTQHIQRHRRHRCNACANRRLVIRYKIRRVRARQLFARRMRASSFAAPLAPGSGSTPPTTSSSSA